MQKKSWSTQLVCLFSVVVLLLVNSCGTTSFNGLKKFSERLVDENKTKTTKIFGTPTIEIIEKPSFAKPNIIVKVFAMKFNRESIVQKYEVLEKTEQYNVLR